MQNIETEYNMSLRYSDAWKFESETRDSTFWFMFPLRYFRGGHWLRGIFCSLTFFRYWLMTPGPSADPRVDSIIFCSLWFPLFPRFLSWDTTIKWATFCITSDKKGTKVWEGRRRPSRKDHGVVKNTHDFSWGQKSNKTCLPSDIHFLFNN